MFTTTARAQPQTIEGEARGLYAAVWRLHFYAGLFVLPFLLILAMTGLVMALKSPLEPVLYRDLLIVEPKGEALPPSTLAYAVADRYPGAEIRMYAPPRGASRSASFAIAPVMGPDVFAQVDPYTAQVLGAFHPETTPFGIAKTIHGTLLMGDAGDAIIEIAAGLGVLLVVSGLFLWWPRGGRSVASALAPKIKKLDRAGLRDLHRTTGLWTSAFLLFFLLSGLAWTEVWGGKLTQVWSAFPAERFRAPVAAQTHETLNHGGEKHIPWALEKTPLPMSGSEAGALGVTARPVNLDAVVDYARAAGFTGFRVNYPRDEAGAWTVAASTMDGDISDPSKDRTLHIDQHTGNVLADVGFADYSPMGKAMAAGIAFHQGDAGPLNIAFNIAYCLAVIAIALTGLFMWLKRRPAKGLRLAAPPLPANPRIWRGAVAAMLLASLALPLTCLAIVVALVVDWAVATGRRAIPAAK